MSCVKCHVSHVSSHESPVISHQTWKTTLILHEHNLSKILFTKDKRINSYHSFPSRLDQIPDCPRHLYYTNSNQTQQNSCHACKTTLPTTTVHRRKEKGEIGPFLSLVN